jgi:hypothetical protein
MYHEPYLFKIYNSMSYDSCIYLRNHHFNKKSYRTFPGPPDFSSPSQPATPSALSASNHGSAFHH